MSELTSDERTCPICGHKNFIKMNLESAAKTVSIDVVASCEDCGYLFHFVAPFLIFVSGSLLAFALLFGSIFLQYSVAGACVWSALIMITVFFFLGFFAKSGAFHGYIDRVILEKAGRMVKEGRTTSRWTGDTYTNKNGLMGKDGLRR